MNDRTPKRLDQLGSVARGKSRHRPRNDPSLYGGRWPFFQTGDVKAAELYLHSFSQTYSDAGLAQSKLWPAGTLCITIAANIADTAILGIPGCFPDSVVGFIADPAQSDARFVKYYIETLKQGMQNASRGTTQDNLSVDKLLTFEFLVPSVQRQREIASILSAYDDLIENNTRRIAILEEMARRIYEEWFVRFRFPGHEGVRMVESELGLVPEGWVIRAFDEIATFTNGFAFKPEHLGAEGSPIVKIKELKAGVQADTPRFAGSLPDRYRIKHGDLLFSWSADLDVYIWGDEDGWLNQHLFLVDALGSATPPSYLFHALKTAMPSFRTRSNGATMKHIKRSALSEVTTVVPPVQVAAAFDQGVGPLHELVKVLSRKNRNLRTTRDLLLPKLISGELDVSPLPEPEALAA